MSLMRRRSGYDVPPSQTRAGQRVDNPFIDTTATGEVQALVHFATQDEWAKQEKRNAG